MIRGTIVAVALISLFAINAARCEDDQLSAKVEIVQNITEYLRANPKLTLVQPLQSSQLSRGQVTYRLGNRITGDRLVAQNSASQQWGTPQNVKLTLAYPQSGIGAVVSYVQVVVDQSINVGNAYVVSGGIGQRQITLVVESNGTLYFRYTSQIYGY